MSDAPASQTRLPLLRLTLLGLLLLIGLALFFTLGRRTPVIAAPVTSEARP
jgi:hypothetical protein